VTEHVAAIEAEFLADSGDLGHEQFGGPHRGVVRLADGRVPAPELVVADDAAAVTG
jgi:hypothetical protein